jgi:PPOX class probable F420-dependent enzyme
MTSDDNWRHLRSADHGILCTSNRQQHIDAVPVCFTVVSKVIATPVDRVKPKETTELGRLRNLDHNATATLLCEQWDPDDWSRLWWVRTYLERLSDHDVGARQKEEAERALRAKYPQYRETEFAAVIYLDVKTLVGWCAGPSRTTTVAGLGGDPG